MSFIAKNLTLSNEIFLVLSKISKRKRSLLIRFKEPKLYCWLLIEPAMLQFPKPSLSEKALLANDGTAS